MRHSFLSVAGMMGALGVFGNPGVRTPGGAGRRRNKNRKDLKRSRARKQARLSRRINRRK